MSEQYAELEQAITTACEAPLVIKWVVIAEVVGAEDGDVYLHSIAKPDMSVWDKIGMLDFHLTFARKTIQVEDD